MEEVHPYALRGPADIPVIEGLARAIDGRRVDPAGARLQHMDDAADHPPIIDARLASRVRWQVRYDPRELPIRQPEMIAIHRRLSSGAGESRNVTREKQVDHSRTSRARKHHSSLSGLRTIYRCAMSRSRSSANGRR